MPGARAVLSLCAGEEGTPCSRTYFGLPMIEND
jgi:hypothetical protein